jgi:Family of unknown function (DUF5681)
MPFPNPGTQFQAGNNANPNGRPRGRSIEARLRELLERTEINGKPLPGGKQVADLVAEALLKGALKGEIRHLQELLNRIEGKVPDRHTVAGPDGGPVRIQIIEVVQPAPRDGDEGRDDGG